MVATPRPKAPAPAPALRDEAGAAARAPLVDGGVVEGAAIWIPHTLSRSARRARRREAKAIALAHDRELAASDRAAQLALRQERAQAAYLPACGEPGRRQLHAYRQLKLHPHQATSNVLGSAYLFLADAGLGSRGLFIGQDAWSGSAFCYDPWVLYHDGVLTNPNVMLAGIIGRGKSALAKSIATRSVAFGRKVYVPGDPKGEWSVVARAVGGKAIELGGGLAARLNPLDPGPEPATPNAQWRREVRRRRLSLLGALAATAMGRQLDPAEHSALDSALDAAVTQHSTPVVPHVVAALFDPPTAVSGSTLEQLKDDGRLVGHALARMVSGDLAGLFDGPSTIGFDPRVPMLSLDLSRIAGSDTLIGMVMTCAASWMEGALAAGQIEQRWVIYDEAWRLLAQPALLARMQSDWKLSRARGIANMAIIHRMSDLDAVGDIGSEARELALGLLADCSTKIIYAQEAGQAELTGHKLGLCSTEVAQLTNLARGEGLWRIGSRAFVVRHLLSAGELELYDTDQHMGERT